MASTWSSKSCMGVRNIAMATFRSNGASPPFMLWYLLVNAVIFMRVLDAVIFMHVSYVVIFKLRLDVVIFMRALLSTCCNIHGYI